MNTPRSVEKLIEAQILRWKSAHADRKAECRRDPVITISRLPGCDGRGLGQELAQRLKSDFFDREILRQVAESSHLSEAILETVAEKARSKVEEWVESLFLERYLSGEYFRHLSKVLMAIAQHGRAVILGHGAGFIIKPDCCLRVLLVASLEERVATAAKKEGLRQEEARRLVVLRSSERRAYIRQHFHVDMLDPVHYDLVLNTASLGREGVLAAIQAAWESRSRAN